MKDKLVEKALKIFRKATYYQRIQLRDWLNNWYEYEKQEKAEYLEEEQDNCSCRDGEINLYCQWCF